MKRPPGSIFRRPLLPYGGQGGGPAHSLPEGLKKLWASLLLRAFARYDMITKETVATAKFHF